MVDHSQGKSLPGVEVDDFESIPGQGLAAVVNVEVTLHMLNRFTSQCQTFLSSLYTRS